MKKIEMVFFVGLLLVISGCSSSQYSITYNTEPTGAALICNGVNLGYTPTTLYYTPSADDRKKGYFNTQKCFAGWVSGARKDFSNTWDLSKFPDGVRQTIQRPSHPGYSQDAEFALKVKQLKATRNVANQQQRAAAAATILQNSQINRGINCYTIGGFTHCY